MVIFLGIVLCIVLGIVLCILLGNVSCIVSGVGLGGSNYSNTKISMKSRLSCVSVLQNIKNDNEIAERNI